jgi:hypothetical protein
MYWYLCIKVNKLIEERRTCSEQSRSVLSHSAFSTFSTFSTYSNAEIPRAVLDLPADATKLHNQSIKFFCLIFFAFNTQYVWSPRNKLSGKLVYHSWWHQLARFLVLPLLQHEWQLLLCKRQRFHLLFFLKWSEYLHSSACRLRWEQLHRL